MGLEVPPRANESSGATAVRQGQTRAQEDRGEKQEIVDSWQRESEDRVQEEGASEGRQRFCFMNSNSDLPLASAIWGLKLLTRRKAVTFNFDELIIIPVGASSLGFATTFLVSFFTAFLVTKK